MKEGYLLINHQASPGLPDDIARKFPVPILLKEGRVFEADTLTCNHCKSVVIKNTDRLRERGHCYRCNHYICDSCAVAFKINNICRPFIQVVDDVKSGKTETPILARNIQNG